MKVYLIFSFYETTILFVNIDGANLSTDCSLQRSTHRSDKYFKKEHYWEKKFKLSENVIHRLNYLYICLQVWWINRREVINKWHSPKNDHVDYDLPESWRRFIRDEFILYDSLCARHDLQRGRKRQYRYRIAARKSIITLLYVSEKVPCTTKNHFTNEACRRPRSPKIRV